MAQQRRRPTIFPLRDLIPSSRPPVVTVCVIVACALAWLVELGQGRSLDRFVHEFGLVPARFTRGDDYVGLFTSMFLHGGWMHILGNMWFLWIFGDNVEDRMGHAGFALFYLLCGVGAGLAQVLVQPDSGVPMVGASGAISGVLGGYIALFPRAQVVTLLPLGIFWQVVRIPAMVFLGLWFLLQFVQGLIAMGARAGHGGGVAWFAHIGGFVAGLALVWIFARRPRTPAPVAGAPEGQWRRYE